MTISSPLSVHVSPAVRLRRCILERILNLACETNPTYAFFALLGDCSAVHTKQRQQFLMSTWTRGPSVDPIYGYIWFTLPHLFTSWSCTASALLQSISYNFPVHITALAVLDIPLHSRNMTAYRIWHLTYSWQVKVCQYTTGFRYVVLEVTTQFVSQYSDDEVSNSELDGDVNVSIVFIPL